MLAHARLRLASPAPPVSGRERHGDIATAKAREMNEKVRRKGDTEGADMWLRIIVAIGTPGT